MLIPTTTPDDMDSAEMIRRAYENGQQLETYDPNQLVADVRELLAERGLNPELPPGTGRAGMAAGGAGMLLRAFGVLPAGDYAATDRLNAPDPESR